MERHMVHMNPVFIYAGQIEHYYWTKYADDNYAFLMSEYEAMCDMLGTLIKVDLVRGEDEFDYI